jgi:hypothetical protein
MGTPYIQWNCELVVQRDISGSMAFWEQFVSLATVQYNIFIIEDVTYTVR